MTQVVDSVAGTEEGESLDRPGGALAGCRACEIHHRLDREAYDEEDRHREQQIGDDYRPVRGTDG
jgi:hypothetical protein